MGRSAQGGITVSSAPESKSLHERAAASAKETRSTLITLSTASIGGLFALVTHRIDPVLNERETLLVLATIAGMVGTLACAIWFGFSDAQWSYWWGVELDPENQKPDAAHQKKLWHARKNFAERAMLILFVVAAMGGGAFVVTRILRGT
jgi:hypothetical protein